MCYGRGSWDHWDHEENAFSEPRCPGAYFTTAGGPACVEVWCGSRRTDFLPGASGRVVEGFRRLRLVRAACAQPCRRRQAATGPRRRQKAIRCAGEGVPGLGASPAVHGVCAVSTAGKRSGVAAPGDAAFEPRRGLGLAKGQ
ncbi:hypothetical protein NDU88_006541 [Pleurodeles waltl]|uniref:Uncharacterized protein n=1 Tax=Pleurodeles waltl TaxID=8319 RepID=A0AAV7N199_PLEWA|nr:hypothetical protein NDU88_006541 [Pleurodeles waltl]